MKTNKPNTTDDRLAEVAKQMAKQLEYWLDIVQDKPEFAAWSGKTRAALGAYKSLNKENKPEEGGICNFNVAWVGKCENENPCDKHKDLKCCVCDNKATRECPETFQFVCGFNLCDDCEHGFAPNGTNGGTLRHCRKTAQKG